MQLAQLLPSTCIKSMTAYVAVAHIGKEACDRRVGFAGVVGGLPVIPVLPSFAQGFLDLWHVLLRQSGRPAVHAKDRVCDPMICK